MDQVVKYIGYIPTSIIFTAAQRKVYNQGAINIMRADRQGVQLLLSKKLPVTGTYTIAASAKSDKQES